MLGRDEVTTYLNEQEFDAVFGSGDPGDIPGGPLPPPDVLVAVTLAPFVTAVAASLGAGLGRWIEGAAVRILRHVPRSAILGRSSRLLRARDEAGDAVRANETDESVPPSLTVTTEGGTRIQLSTHTPVDALATLPTVDFTDVHELGEVPTTVRWIGSGWRAVSIKDGQIIDAEWHPESRQWISLRF
ncbi:hypothetical protein [Streptomyces sp. NPDC056527]|uniref:hypothetical protein n=1 Tax=Streptomyces sp. NPDC056527 TaxID=3345853 RepID=UPI003698D830